MLSAREPRYAHAHAVVDTSGGPPPRSSRRSRRDLGPEARREPLGACRRGALVPARPRRAGLARAIACSTRRASGCPRAPASRGP
jgi:hypothetical protein